jgi:hypothetical protein
MKLSDGILMLTLIAVIVALLSLPSLADTPSFSVGEIALDSSDNVYVTMGPGSATAEGLYVYAPDGRVLKSYFPERYVDVAIGSDDTIYVSNIRQKSIERLEKNGSFSVVWHEDDPGRSIVYMTIDRDGNLYVVNSGHPEYPDLNITGRMVKLSPDGRILDEIGGSPSVPLDRMFKMSISGNGTIYIADGSSYIRAIYPDGGRSGFIPAGTGKNPPLKLITVAAGNDGYLYVADIQYTCVYRLTENGTVVTAWDGCGPERFVTPGEIATDGNGRIYVSDLMGQRVVWFDSNKYQFGENATENAAGRGVLWDSVLTKDSKTPQQILGGDIMAQSIPGYDASFALVGLFLAGIFLCLREARRS